MGTHNFYWPVYKNLEKEFLMLADYVHFSDDQVKIYSMRIADLIVRCAIEIEALSKELYGLLGGDMSPLTEDGKKRDLYFDTDCIALLDEKWHICKKEVSVSAINFYFESEIHRVLTPLKKANKRGSSGSKWKQAYQAVKHDRGNSLKMATIENLLNAMAALFVLNVYYRDERIDLGNIKKTETKFDGRLGSNVFCVSTCSATVLRMEHNMDDSNICMNAEDLEKAIYITKYDDKSFVAMHKDFCLDSEITLQRFYSSVVIQKYLDGHPDEKDKTLNQICVEAGGLDLLKEILSHENAMRNQSVRMEAVLNKHTSIYPSVALEH